MYSCDGDAASGGAGELTMHCVVLVSRLLLYLDIF